ncbi:MAG: hypothetical protein MUO54_00390, partial [Anaerolineales bacterium]|nr:hypothetical protein [Anaerolineales bacterium]
DCYIGICYIRFTAWYFLVLLMESKDFLRKLMNSNPKKIEGIMPTKLSTYQDYLENVRIPLRLACKTETGWPLVLSLWFVYLDEYLYCATQKDARVIRYLSAEPKCAYEIASDLPPYCGIRGQAVAELDDNLGPEILDLLFERYLGGTENKLAKTLGNKKDSEVAIRLKPINSFQWNFSGRMTEIAPSMLDMIKKHCP